MGTTIATAHDGTSGQNGTYPSNDNGVAYLWDGSLLVLANDAPNLVLYQIASPGGASPTASTVKSVQVSGAGSSSIQHGDIFVADNGAGGNDVWITCAENNNIGGANVTHGVYNSSGVWSWDATTSVIADGNFSGAINMVSLVWTGTYLIVGLRSNVSGSAEYAINYTTTKNGTSGWLSNLVRLSSSFGGSTHYFGQLLHDASLGCTVAIYSINGDTLQSRVLPDSSSPALANWGAETALGTGTLSLDTFQGAAALIDSGRVHVAYRTGTGTGVKSPGYVTGTITVNGTSSAVSWGTPIAVGTQGIGSMDCPNLAIDGSGKVFMFWTNHYLGNTAALIRYATIDSPYTSASAETSYTGTGCTSPKTPRNERCKKGYIPLVYTQGTASPYNIVYDNAITAATGGGSSVQGAASIEGDGTLSTVASILYAGKSSLSVDGNLAATAAMLYAGVSSLSADGNLAATGARLVEGAISLAADGDLTSAAVVSYAGAALLSSAGNLAAVAVTLYAAAIALSAEAVLAATGISNNSNYQTPTGTILLQAALAALAAWETVPSAVIIFQPTPEGSIE